MTAAKGIFHSPPRGHLRRLKLDGCGRTELSGFSGRIINAPVGSSRMTWSIAQKNERAQYFTSAKSYRGAQRGRCRQAYLQPLTRSTDMTGFR